MRPIPRRIKVHATLYCPVSLNGNASPDERIVVTVLSQGKTALVLSAGGMFGAYQAGVWDVLQNQVSFDIVVGASVGSLNGCLIAKGFSGAQLTQRWMSLGETVNVRWRIPQRLSDGCLDSSRLQGMIRDLCNAGRTVCEFGVVATQCRTMRPHLFRGAEIEWTHIAASCAVPLFLQHFRIGGKLYTDGGLIDPLPVWAALEMGATRVIGVNLLKDRPPLLDCVMRTAQRFANYRPPLLDEIDFIEIAPTRPLGTPKDAMYWNQEKCEQWIEYGHRDAVDVLDRVVEWQCQCRSTVFTV